MRDTTDDGFRAFVDARWPALVRFAWSLTGDRGHAEDVVQAVLVRTWRGWGRIRLDGAGAYVRAAVVNETVSRARRRRVREVVLPWTGERPEPVPARDAAEDRAVADSVAAELARLPPRMRAVVVLRFLEDRSEAETAALLGCSPGTVKSQTNRAMARLRDRTPLRDLVGVPAVDAGAGEEDR
ncbi:MAG: SigE family RNA polymerase sigma factor [Actinobacteria bacterium]|nr:SigE family RNA polymerase sigma factor [Actinomycetota bacterium]